SFYSKALVTKEKVYVFVTPETPVSAKAKKEHGLEFVVMPFTEVQNHLDQLQNTIHFDEVWFDPGTMNSADFSMLVKGFGMGRLKEKHGGLYEYQSINETVDLRQMVASFRKADQAIYNTIKWVKESMKAGKRLTVLDLYNEASERYTHKGA